MISGKMTKTERLRKEMKSTSKVSKTNQRRMKDTVVADKPMKIKNTRNIDVSKLKPNPATLTRIRKCSKSQPLPPTKTGVKKPVPKRVTTQVKPKLRNRKLKTLVKAKNKSCPPKTNGKAKKVNTTEIIKKISQHSFKGSKQQRNNSQDDY